MIWGGGGRGGGAQNHNFKYDIFLRLKALMKSRKFVSADQKQKKDMPDM